MAEKKIEIKIAATGGSQAAAEVAKVGAAVKAVAPASEDAAGAMDDLNAQMDDMIARAKNLQKETQDLNEEIASNTQQIRLGRAAAVGTAVGGAILAKTFREIAQGLQSIDVDKLREMDSAMAEQVETARGWAEVLTDPLNGIQRLISGSTISEAFADVNEQLTRNAEVQAEAIDRMIQNGRRTAAEIAALAKDIAAANAILDAKDAADAAERDAADAEAVRGGAAPEDVRAQRAAFDRDRELERLSRSLDPKAAAAQAAFDDSQVAAGNAQRVAADPRATADGRAKALAEAEKARAAFEEAKREYDAAKGVVIEQRRGVNARFQTEVGDAAGDKETRLREEKEKAAQQAKREAEKLQRESERAAEQRTRDEAGVGRDAKGLLNEAGKLLPNGLPEKFQRDTEAIIAGLQDGDQGGEAQKLADAMARLAQAVQGRSKATDIKLQQLDAAIALLNQKVKNK